MKRISAAGMCILFAAVSLQPVRAEGSLGFVLDAAEPNPDYLFGIIPVFFRLGPEYETSGVVDGRATGIAVLVGAGVRHNKPWTDAAGSPILPGSVTTDSDVFRDLNTFNDWQADLELTVAQAIADLSPARKSVLSIYGRYNFLYFSPFENGSDSWFLSGASSAYPDQDGAVVNSVTMGIDLDFLNRDEFREGVDGKLYFSATPHWLANAVVGYSDFYRAGFTARLFHPLLDLRQERDDLVLAHVDLADRLWGDYIFGDAVPQTYKAEYALGTRMRGFEGSSYGTGLAVANNLELRLYGPEIIPRLNPFFNLFLDAGIYAGRYYDTDLSGRGFLCSTGMEAGINTFNWLQLGYHLAIPLLGTNISQKRFVSAFMATYFF